MKKILIFIVCIMCLLVTGCEKKGETLDLENISGELNASGEDISENSNVVIDELEDEKNDYMKEYHDLMNSWDRSSIIQINFIDSSKQQFSDEYLEKAEISFNGEDKVDAYLKHTEDGNIVYFVSNGDIKLKDAKRMFENLGYCTEINGIELLNTEKVSNMEGMFAYCKSLTSLDVSNFDTSNVTTMAYMFFDCEKLTSLDVSKFNTSEVLQMYRMFGNCFELTSIDVSNFDTSNVIGMDMMFSYCSSLKNLDLSNFDTMKVTSMSGMFEHCGKLTSLDVSSFDTSNVTTMKWMFAYCSNLTNLDISNFDTSSIVDIENMFVNYLNLEYFFTKSSTEMIKAKDLYNLSSWELNLAKDEIFARHGHDFSSKKLKAYFNSREWYVPIANKKVAVSELNEIEQSNVTLIDKIIERRKVEKSIIIIEKIEAPKLEYDWDLEPNKYPLEQKVLCYEGEYNQGDEKNKLSIYFNGYSYNDYVDSNYEVIINDITNEIITDDIYIIDLDESDEYIELVGMDYWENGVWSTIYRYVNNELICMGSSIDYINGLINYNGKFVPSYNVYHFLEEPLIPRYYVIENGQFVRKFTQYDEVKDKTYTVTQEILEEIECYDKLSVGDKIKILSLNDETDSITGDSQGVILRVMNENGEIFEIGYVGSWT